MEDFIIAAHVAYVVDVSQQSHNIFVFLHTSSSKHKTFNVQKNAECQQILNKKNIVHVDPLELIGAQSILFLMNNTEIVEVFSSNT